MAAAGKTPSDAPGNGSERPLLFLEPSQDGKATKPDLSVRSHAAKEGKRQQAQLRLACLDSRAGFQDRRTVRSSNQKRTKHPYDETCVDEINTVSPLRHLF